MSDPTDQITPGERRELRSVVRSQMKVLRAEVEQREAELMAEAESRLTARFADQDKALADANRRIAEIAGRFNDEVQGVLAEITAHVGHDEGQHLSVRNFGAPRVFGKTEDRTQLRRAMEAGVKARVKQARTELDRQEADLLRDLAIDGLQTSAARAFLQRIPSAAQLVPSSKLREIEAQFDQGRPA